MKRRILSIFCVLALCLGLLPTTALAANDPVTYLTWSEEQSKLVTDTCDSYTSLTSSSNISSLGTEGQQKWYVLKGNNSRRFRIEVKGDVHLILSNNCTLTAQQGIHVTDGSSLTIYAQSEDADAMGKLVALSGDDYLTYHYCAVIGGNGTDTAGSITINGGNITATGKSDSGAYGAAIGTGCYSTSGSTDSTMAITINGGIVTAEATGGGAAIGTGYRTGGGTITINGGTINATSNGDGAAIGTGYTGNGGTISINGGTVQATSNNSGAAIGVGDSGTLGTVNITGGQITAAALNQRKASESGAAIGCGYFYKTDGKIYISGGTINITAGYLNGIGYGHYKSSTSGSSSITITITGGSICNSYKITTTPVNSSNAPVYKTKVDLSDVSGIDANQAVSGSITGCNYYGFNDVYTDDDTCLYLYLPAGETTATFGGKTFQGTVSAGDGNVLTASDAAKDPVSYIDKTGQQYSAKYYTVVTDTTSAWTTGWYVVSGNTTISNRIEVTGNVSLILTDGATLTASAGIHVPETASLDICGQSGGTGKLKATASEGNAAIGGNGGEKETTGTISICSGTVEATGGSGGGAGIGGGANCYNGTDTRGTVAIYGGAVKATGGNGGAGIGTGKDGQINNIILAGGTIEANGGGDSAQDIGLGGGTSTLDGVMEFDAGHGGVEEDGGEPVLQSVSGSETNHRYDLDIRGGSIYTSGGTEAVTAPDPYNSNYGGLAVKNKIVYYAEADFGTGYTNQPVSGTITVGDSDYQYSFNGVKTDASGKLHLYTFAGDVELTANGSTFEGAIDATHSKLTRQQQPLSGTISIEGTVQCGETLTVNTESVTPADAKNSLTYTWYRCTSSDGSDGAKIENANTGTYTLTTEDIDKYIKVEVTSTEYSGTLSATTSQVQKAPTPITITGVTVTNRTYDGTTAVTVTDLTFEGLQGSDSISKDDLDISAMTATVSSADAGTYPTVTLGGMIVVDNVNYTLTMPTEPVQANNGSGVIISKATATAVSDAMSVSNKVAQTYTYNLSQLLPTLDGGKSLGEVTYALDAVDLGSYYNSSSPATISGSTLTLPIQAVDSDTAGSIGTVKVTINSTNFEPMTAIIAVSSVNKQTQTVTISGQPSSVVYGDSFTLTAHGEGSGAVTWSATGCAEVDSTGKVTVTGAGSFTITAAVAEDDTYAAASNGINITAGKKTLTVKAPSIEIHVKDSIPDLSGLSCTIYGLVGEDSLTDVTLSYAETPDSSTTGSYAIVPSGGSFTTGVKDNYDIQYMNGTLTITSQPTPTPTYYMVTVNGGTGGGSYQAGQTVTITAEIRTGYTFKTWTAIGVTLSNPDSTTVTFLMPENDVTLTSSWTANSTGGGSTGGGGGSSSSNITTETTKNPDGSTTTTVTNNTTGTVTETTTWPDGSKEVIETKKDGTVTTTTTDADGNKTEVVEKPDGSSKTTVDNKDGSGSVTLVDADGNIISQATLSEAAVAAAQEKGEAVALPMPEVPVTSDRETAPTVTVDLPVGGSVKVEIPVEDVTAGTVAVLVKSNGDEEIIKTSVTTGSGVTVTLNDGDTVKIVDNSRDFADVPDNYWGAEAVDFAVSRELFAGTSATTFSPNTAMTRAMIVTVLARFEGVDTSTGENWYDAGAQWAVEEGISDGTNLDQDLNREQLATMLWRYAGEPVPTASLDAYGDAASVSSYARQAMAWAVETGLIQGVTGDTLRPQGEATRAQVSTILQRFVETFN